jgi:hypothetical protein
MTKPGQTEGDSNKGESIISNSPIRPDQELLSMIKRIADHPTRGEIVEGADEAAKEILEDNK